jgi:HAD superfamily hydrolase (TIGR01509 family)
MPIQAVFWDYDNTILETAEAHWNKHRAVLAQHCIELDEKYRKRVYENNGSQNWIWMNEQLGLKIPQKEYLHAIDLEFQRNILYLEFRSGITELCQLIRDLSIPQAIVTNARRESAEPVLKEKDILSLMDFVLFKEDYEGRKPDPTPYLVGFEKMAQLIGKPLDPKKCIVVEDDPKGVESAHRAGAIVIYRKLGANDPNTPYANYSCFDKEDFIRIMKNLLLDL